MNRYFGLHTLEGEWHSLLPRYMLLSERVKGKRVLDIGCGTGIGASMLLELEAQAVDAIDHRPEVLELGRMKHAKQGLDFHVMFPEELDFPDNTFDTVLCLDPSSPVTDPSLIKEVLRVLKPGGEYICAVETKRIDGLEKILPRYGYAEAAESIDVHQASDRVPQIGELQEHFQRVTSVVQKPILAHVFDLPESEDRKTASVRKIDESGVSGVWSESEGPDADENGRWVSVDMRLTAHDTEVGSVEIFFCADAEGAVAPLREIHLPYYSLVSRLQQVVGDLQTMDVRSDDNESIFNEVMDSSEDVVERHPTSEFKAVSWEREATGVHQRVDLPQYRPANDEVDDLHAKVVELTDLYSQVKKDFQRVVADASNALDERDQYIGHLVHRVQDWETRFYDDEPGSLDEPTSAFTPLSPPRDGRLGELEAELARMRDEQRRLKAELNAKESLAALNEADEESESSGEPGAKTEEE